MANLERREFFGLLGSVALAAVAPQLRHLSASEPFAVGHFNVDTHYAPTVLKADDVMQFAGIAHGVTRTSVDFYYGLVPQGHIGHVDVVIDHQLAVTCIEGSQTLEAMKDQLRQEVRRRHQIDHIVTYDASALKIQHIEFNMGFVDGGSCQAWLKANGGTIAQIVGDAAGGRNG